MIRWMRNKKAGIVSTCLLLLQSLMCFAGKKSPTWEISIDSATQPGKNATWEILATEHAPDFQDSTHTYWLRTTIPTTEKQNGSVIGLMLRIPIPVKLYVDGKCLFNPPADYHITSTSFGKPVLWAVTHTGNHRVLIRVEGPYPWNWNAFNPDGILTTNVGNRAVAQYVTGLMAITVALICLAAVFFAFGFVHLIIFFFYRKEISNLYYSVFVLSLGTVFFSVWYSVFTESERSADMASLVILMACALASLALPAISHTLHREKLPLYFKITTLVGLAITVCCILLGGLWILLVGLIYIFGVIDSMVNIILSIIRRREGAWILGTGILVFGSFILFVTFFGAANQGLQADTFSGVLLIVGSILAIPFSMSTYLAFKSARINHSLQVKLREVESLSEKNLQQEQEKQRILENQKEKLEEEVALRTREIREQKNIIEEKNKEVTDSIYYAQRIQQALLASEKEIRGYFSDLGILYQPRDIVSGDFYWSHAGSDCIHIVNGDCTGHGVPGAFMSLLNITYLNEAVKERSLTRPGEILDYVRDRIIASLSSEEHELQDGMDASICRVHTSGLLETAGANHTIWIFRKTNELLTDLPAGWKQQQHTNVLQLA